MVTPPINAGQAGRVPVMSLSHNEVPEFSLGEPMVLKMREGWMQFFSIHLFIFFFFFLFWHLHYGFPLEHLLFKFNDEIRLGINGDQGDSWTVDFKKKRTYFSVCILLRQRTNTLIIGSQWDSFTSGHLCQTPGLLFVVFRSLSYVWLFGTPMGCSPPASSVLHYLLEFAQIWVQNSWLPLHNS